MRVHDVSHGIYPGDARSVAPMEATALLAIIVLAAIVAIALRLRFRRPHPGTYEVRPALLTPAESVFYQALLAAVSNRYVVAPKVRVADVLTPPAAADRSTRTSLLNKISQKHFDFVLCEPQTFAFVAAIELDDKSHDRRPRVMRDKFLNEVAAAAQLQLHRIKARSLYTVAELRTLIPVLAVPVPCGRYLPRINRTRPDVASSTREAM